MNREKQLVKNTIIVAIGKICTQFISFILLPLYTAILSTKEYGIVDLLNTYISLLLPLVFFQMNQSIFRHLIDVRKDEEEKKKYISTCLMTVSIQSLLYIIVYLTICIFIDNEYKYFLATNVIAAMFSDIMLQTSRGLGDNKTYSIGSIISGSGTIILNVIFLVIFKFGAYGMLLASLISNILCALYVFIKKKIYLYFSITEFDVIKLKELWKYSIPLIPNQLSWWIINASDRTIVSYFLGIAVNGVYSAANKFSSICITIFSIFNMTWSESASIHVKDSDSSDFFSNIFNKTLKIFIPLCVLIISIMPLVFHFIITGKGYANAYYQIPILMIATIFSIIVSLLGSIYVALKKSNEIAKTSLLAALINITTNLLLIKFIGLYAASISTLVSYLSMSIYRFRDVKKYIIIKFDTRFVIISTIISIVTVLVYYVRNPWLSIVCVIMSILFAYIYNKDILKYMFSLKTYKHLLMKTNKN